MLGHLTSLLVWSWSYISGPGLAPGVLCRGSATDAFCSIQPRPVGGAKSLDPSALNGLE